MTAAQLREAREHTLLDLGAYVDAARPAMAEHRETWRAAIRVHQVSRPVLVRGRVAMQHIWLMSEGLN